MKILPTLAEVREIASVSKYNVLPVSCEILSDFTTPIETMKISAPTTICEIRDGWFKSTVITPEEFGFERCTKEDLKGGTPEENAKITLAILNGEKGHKRNAALMNAGAALYIGGKADSMKEGIALAAEIIDSGKALETLNQLIEVSNRPEVEA